MIGLLRYLKMNLARSRNSDWNPAHNLREQFIYDDRVTKNLPGKCVHRCLVHTGARCLLSENHHLQYQCASSDGKGKRVRDRASVVVAAIWIYMITHFSHRFSYSMPSSTFCQLQFWRSLLSENGCQPVCIDEQCRVFIQRGIGSYLVRRGQRPEGVRCPKSVCWHQKLPIPMPTIQVSLVVANDAINPNWLLLINPN